MTDVTPSPHRSPDTPAAPAARAGRGRVELEPAQAVQVSVARRPFTLPLILPIVVLAVCATDVALLFGLGQTLPNAVCGGLLMVTTGALLIPAIALRGSLEVNADGVVFRRGSQTISAPWSRVAGISMSLQGPRLELISPAVSHRSIRMPGGLGAGKGRAVIPLALFGTGQATIVAACRDRLNGQQMAALQPRRSPVRDWVLLGISAVVAVGIVILATAMLVTP